MPKIKVRWKHKKWTVRIKYLAMVVGILVSGLGGAGLGASAETGEDGCPDVMGIFVRGSGEERRTGVSFLEFRNTLSEKLETTELSYDFLDLDYPAVAVDFGVGVSAFFSGGEAYNFGASVYAGVRELKRVVNSGCANTRYVIGGYSQGAIVVIKTLPELDAERVLYAATFGDPKLYLPEGAGLTPAACYNRGLSDYRMYVPDCFAWNGKLGGQNPYRPAEYAGKVGTWCNKHDIMCSPYLSLDAHISYVADNLYEDASRVMFEKIADYFEVRNRFVVPHDTAILVDSTGSMLGMIDEYKAEALRLAREVLENGGRVALYDYRDLDDPYEPVKHCDFGNCDLGRVVAELDNIGGNIDGGGDTPESLLSASYHIMRELDWKVGHTKSLVILTDAIYLAPDRDGIGFADVVRLSKQIDPVNFYIITADDLIDEYAGIAEATGGKVAKFSDNLSLLTDEIIARSDSLPRVEEVDVFGVEAAEIPELSVVEVADGGEAVTIYFQNTGIQALVILNDAWLGLAKGNEVTIGDLDRSIENKIVLTPLSDTIKGDSVEVILEERIPMVPDTGVIGSI